MDRLKKREDGTIELPEGSLFLPNGGVRLLDGKILCPGGTVLFPNGETLHPDGSVGPYDPGGWVSKTSVEAHKGDRTSALAIMQSFVKRYKGSDDEDAHFIAACLADYLQEPEAPDFGELLKKAFKQHGKIDHIRRRTECILEINAFCGDFTSKERNSKIRAALRHQKLDDGETDVQLNKAISNTLRRK